ncbi:family 43 glycosylhydrolase [Roseivirga sp.]|uniref:family 43 glycosylhydrolase n=1 Tax=Roseivirga sp. TaxID=1964215 RepID=UPI003B516FEF
MILRARKEWVSMGALVLMMALAACTPQKEETTQVSTFQNPIFPGDYPDPSVLRDGDDYYIVHSSFEYYPGLLIWHSKDLLNWTPVTNALTKYVGSVWAPELVKYEDRYYIYFPASNTNYVIWADAIDGPWSDPIQLDVTMIDPGHVADSEGNRYLYFSSGSYVPLSKDGLSITGDVQHVYDGWPIPREWSIECFCMEGPKLFKRGEYYYLTVAEGGTAGPATGHMVISARSKSPLGPWENAPNNPILRTESSEETWWSVGHGTVLDDAEGNWWMIFHGYEKDHYNMGRQTMMVPIEWTEDDWYRIPEGVDITQPIRLPDDRQQHTNSSFTDPFEEGQLNPQWKFFEGYDQNRVELETQGILIKGKGTSVAGSSPMLYVPSDHDYTVEVELEIQGNATGGLLLFYNNNAFSGILADQANVLANLRGWQFVTEEQVIDRHVFLRLKNEFNTVDMYYSTDGTDWIKIENSFESSGYHHNILSGFMSLRIGLTALGDGKVKFSNFKYHPLKP